MAVDKQAIVILAPLIQKQFHFSLVMVTQMLAARIWAYALFQLPSAWLAERLTPQRTLGIAVFLWSISVLATPLASIASVFLICRVAMGIGQSPDWTASVMIIRRSFPVQKRARANAYLLGTLYAGSLISGPLCVAVANPWGWQAVFYLYGGIGLVFGLLLLVFLKPVRRDGSIQLDQANAARVAQALPLSQMFRSSQVHALGVSYFFLVGIQSFFFALFPLYLVQARHQAMSDMGWLASVPFITLSLAAMGGGWISDVVMRKTGSVLLARAPMAIGSLLGSVLFFAIGLSCQNIVAMTVFLCCDTIGIGLGQVAIWSSVQDLSDGGGMLAGYAQLLGNLALGGTPILAAFVVQATGDWNNIRYLVVTLGLAGSLAFWFVRPDRPLRPTTAPG